MLPAMRIGGPIGRAAPLCVTRRCMGATPVKTIPPNCPPNWGSATWHRIPQKRASRLLYELRWEEFGRLQGGRKWPDFKAGDSIEVTRKAAASTNEIETLRGVVIARTKRCSESAFSIANVEEGCPLVRRLHLFDPLIQDIKVLQKAFIHGGKKPVRRSKIYYILDRHPDTFTVPYDNVKK